MVSFHAITRYVQRMLGVTVPGMEEDANLSATAVALAHCQLAGVTRDQVCAAILQPVVVAALALGASSARTREFEAILSRVPPMVMTVTSLEERRNARVRRMFSEREGRRMGKRIARQRRRGGAGVHIS